MTPEQLLLADQLLTQGLSFWAQFEAAKNSGALTQEDLDRAQAKLAADITQLEADVAAGIPPA